MSFMEIPELLVWIAQGDDCEKRVRKAFMDMNIPMVHQYRGIGTAPSEILDLFGLGGTVRYITLGIVPKKFCYATLREISQKMRIKEQSGGIGFSLALSAAPAYAIEAIDNKKQKTALAEWGETKMGEKIEYVALWVSVTKGFSDKAVEAARRAGARGATIIKGNRACDNDEANRLGTAIQDEQEAVLVIVPKAMKNTVMNAISEDCGMTTDAHGTIIALPIDETVGLH